MRNKLLAASVVATVLACPASRDARAETWHSCNGFIDSVPTTISTQGVWCFDKDLSSALASGTLVTIDANNVTLDCNGFKLGGLSAGLATTTTGILVGPERANATLRNCNLRGFATGIQLQGYDSYGHLVEHNQLTAMRSLGIDADGASHVIRHNRIVDTGGSTIYTGRYAIVATGDADIIDNIVDGVVSAPGSWVVGIQVGGAMHSIVRDNRVRNIVSDAPSEGIAVSGSVLVEGNHVALGTHPASAAIRCFGGEGDAVGNRTQDFAIAIDGCSDRGGNVDLDD